MHPDMLEFIDLLYRRCTSQYASYPITFTAIHPDGQHPTPSRHILLNDRAALLDALQQLSDTNQMGWGAYFAVGLRRPGLTRWKRGGAADVVALPAFYIDIDHPTDATLTKLKSMLLHPSILAHSGGGIHAYWLLDEPTTDLSTARQILQKLAKAFNGDSLSPANSLRLPGTINTKPERGSALCHLVEVSDHHYSLSDFRPFTLPIPGSSTSEPDVSHVCQSTNNRKLNDILIHAITTLLYRDYAARERRQSEWIAALCPCGHARDSPGTHFFWNPTLGCGRCHGRHGTLRLSDLCSILGINAAAYGGIYR
jgi:hypothetical protein